jgi:antitoxin component HigA of HigAB toxin-antitoxin module
MSADTAPADELHRLALARIDKLMSAEAGTPDGDELSVLADAVESYEQKRWPMTDTAPAADDLVTEEMIEVGSISAAACRDTECNLHDCVAAALRAVAPLIAARAITDYGHRLTYGSAVTAEREACAKIAEMWESPGLAAAIRSRGETP